MPLDAPKWCKWFCLTLVIKMRRMLANRRSPNGECGNYLPSFNPVQPPRAFSLAQGSILPTPATGTDFFSRSRIVSSYSAVMSRLFRIMSSSHTHHEPSSSLAAPDTEQKVESISTQPTLALRL